jgi:hypothetical protein
MRNWDLGSTGMEMRCQEQGVSGGADDEDDDDDREERVDILLSPTRSSITLRL